MTEREQRLSDQIVQRYLDAFGNAALVVNRGTGRTHLARCHDHQTESRCECGNPVYATNTHTQEQIRRRHHWCYSCLGNALESLEATGAT